jgi:toxin CcdB
MAQLDVHRNGGRHKNAIPLIVVVQSSQFDGYRRRVVVPLVRAGALGKMRLLHFNPMFKMCGVAVVLHPLEILSVAVRQLGPKVGTVPMQSWDSAQMDMPSPLYSATEPSSCARTEAVLWSLSR